MSDSLTIGGKGISEFTQEQATPSMPTKLSQLTNDSNFVTSSGHVASVTSATNTTSITGTTGITAGTYGPTANVTIGNYNTGTIKVPYFVVNAQGRVTSVASRTLSITTGCSQCSNCGNCSYCTNTSSCSNCSNCSQSCSEASSCNCQP